MILVSVMYPGGDGATFDHDYYMASHIPLVSHRWSPMGLESIRVLKGHPAPDGAPALYPMMALLTFASMQSFEACGAAHGAEIFGDIPNFTNVKPVLQVNDILA